jgi:DNA-binding NarL/FixJ family response regulator
MSVYRVLVAEHDDATRTKVREALRRSLGFGVCAEEVTAVSAVASAVRESPDLCVIDKDVPGGGISAAWEIAGRLPHTKIVLLAAPEDGSGLVLALSAGVSGFVNRDGDLQRLPVVLRSVMNGEVAVPRNAVAQIVAELGNRRARRRSVTVSSNSAPLTSREWEVLGLLCDGEETAGIARRLHISPATVRSHTAHALRKLGLPNRESAVRALGRR